jgi:hypothetical protein
MQQQKVPWLNLEYFFNKFFDFIENFVPWMFAKFDQFFGISTGFFRYAAMAVIFIAAAGLIFVIVKILEVKYRKKIYFSDFFESSETSTVRRDTWGSVKRRLDSSSDDDWELAVVEADVIVENIMERIGFKGLTLGDKIKSIDERNFANLKNLWEAHAVRIKIDIGGAEYKITKEEAKEALDKYEKALKELKYL